MQNLFVILLAIAAGAAIAQTPQHEVGDWWILKDPNTGALETLVVREVAPNGDITLFDEKTGKQHGIYTAELNKKMMGDDVYRPHNWNFSFPLTPGKKWDEFASVDTPGTGMVPRGTYSFRMVGVVKGAEDITLPLLTGEKTFSTERVEIDFVTRGWTTKISCWYSQAMRFPARCISPNDRQYRAREVVAFGRSGDQKPAY